MKTLVPPRRIITRPITKTKFNEELQTELILRKRILPDEDIQIEFDDWFIDNGGDVE